MVVLYGSLYGWLVWWVCIVGSGVIGPVRAGKLGKPELCCSHVTSTIQSATGLRLNGGKMWS